jgi:uncharacterized protein YndB with AHSA1/START domain
MTTPDVPMRIEFEVEVPGTPEQVWAAIATADGLSSWFSPTDVDERLGGALVIHMGETDSPAVITGWDPPRRLAYEEPEWCTLVGHPGAEVTALASEFIVEARSGGTCVVRVVSSAFGTGAEWEQETMDDMKEWWAPSFDLLRLYLDRFPGQRATHLEVMVDVSGEAADVRAAIDGGLGAREAGQPLEAVGLVGRITRLDERYLHVAVDEPVPGFLSVGAMDKGDGVVSAWVNAWLFGEGAAEVAEDRTEAWRDWLKNLPVSTAATGPA